MKKIINTFLLIAILSCPQGHAEEFRGDSAIRFLDGIEKSFSSIHSLKIGFVQEKRMEIFSDKLISSGVIYFKSPDKMRMEYEKPFRSLMIVNENSVDKFEWTANSWKKIDVTNPDVSKTLGRQISGWLTGQFKKQTPYYSFMVESTSPVVLKLSPQVSGIKDIIRDIRVTFTSDQKQVKTVEIHEMTGDQTTMTFSGQENNPSIQPGLFQSP